MTLLYVDSFDHYSTDEIPDKGWSTSGVASIKIGVGRRGGNALGTTSTLITDAATQSFTDSDTIIVGCALKMGEFKDRELLIFKEAGGSEVARMEHTSAGEIKLVSGGVTEITAVAAYDPNAYSYYELKYTKGTGSDGIAELRKDTSVILSISTSNETAQCSSLTVLENEAFYDPLLDDLYILNGLGSSNNDYLGDVRVDVQYTDADGQYTDFTASTGAASYTHVDDVLTDNDATFTESGSIADKEVYSVDAATLGTVIHGVQQVVHNRKTDAGTVTVDLITDKPSGSGLKVNGAALATSNDFTFLLAILETDPDDSTTWTDAKINAEEFGYRIEGIVT